MTQESAPMPERDVSPATEAGRDLLDNPDTYLGPVCSEDSVAWSDSAEAVILAIEQEAAAIERRKANRYESALSRIDSLGMDAPAFGPKPEDFYRQQLETAIGVAARAILDELSPPSSDRGA